MSLNFAHILLNLITITTIDRFDFFQVVRLILYCIQTADQDNLKNLKNIGLRAKNSKLCPLQKFPRNITIFEGGSHIMDGSWV